VTVASELRLRPLKAEDEKPAQEAHDELAGEGHSFLLGWEPQVSWSQYVKRLERIRSGHDLPSGWVPSAFLIAELKGALVGRISLRHRLTDFLENFGGHIGYAVRPAYRRRGIATEILRQGVIIARAEGIEQILVTCDQSNRASASIIARAGGVLEDVRVDPEGIPRERYWIR
jgi:predicted acetyltransferase